MGAFASYPGDSVDRPYPNVGRSSALAGPGGQAVCAVMPAVDSITVDIFFASAS